MTEMKATREGFGEELAEIGEKNKDIVVLDADLSKSTKSNIFAKKFPERFFEMGISEADMIGTAAGLALCGKIPFACTFAVFATGRTYDQIRLSVAYSELNVKIVGSHGGLLTGEDGVSHQATEDVSLMRGLPKMAVVVPADAIEAAKATKEIAKHNSPVYLRLARPKTPIIFDENYNFRIGKGIILREGKDVSIIACGPILNEALKATEMLAKKKISAEVINMATVKPIDKELLLKTAKKTKAVVTAEDHSIIGGLGSAVAEVLAENAPLPVEMIGVQDLFAESGKADELYAKYGLDAKAIVKKAEKAIGRKKK